MKMTSQGSDAATQVLSNSQFDTILNRSRNAGQGQAHEQDQEEETQFTLHEGDEGHIDLISSLVSRQEAAEEDVGSDPVNYSPTQSQHLPSQFQEPPRFKTPATAGKKRKYNGDVVESPELPRNPLLRGGAENHAKVMRLTQAFAATQADTSPLIHNLNGELPSDRPSPNIELQPRPMTATTSSPLRPISTFQRASTEPASRYVSVKQSQAERERQALLKRQECVDDYDLSDDEFGDLEESSHLVRTRREREIDQRSRLALDRLSEHKRSMRRASLSKSSPIRGPGRASPQEISSVNHNRFLAQSSPVRDNQTSPGNESEEETEQEDDAVIAVTRSSQVLDQMDDEDKENISDHASQIPETTARLLRVMNDDLPAHVQESPSLRPGRRLNDRIHETTLDSSQHLAVADSQASQPWRQSEAITQVPKSSTAEGGVEFVPQSPTASPRRTVTVIQLKIGPDGHAAQEGEINPVATVETGIEPIVSSHTRQPPQDTIPETSSNEEQVQNGKGTVSSSDKHENTDVDSRAEFETAQSHLQPSTTVINQPNTVELSSPPIVSTPPGRRRQRIAEITAEPSPLKSQVSFNASEALRLDANFQSPVRRSPLPQEIAVNETTKDAMRSNLPHKENDTGADQYPGHQRAQTNAEASNPLIVYHDSEHLTTSAAPVLPLPQHERRPTAKLLSVLKPQTQINPSASRSSKWDLDVSPPQKSVPVIKPSGLNRKARDSCGSRNETPGVVNMRLKSAKGKVDPKAPLSSHLDGRNQNENPDPTVLNESAEPGVNDKGSSVSSEAMVAPNMIFACFNGKTRAYYPALCLGRVSTDTNRFLIQWEGYDPDELDEYGVRSLDLRLGDQVKVNMEGFPKVSYVIRGFKDKIIQDSVPDRSSTITDIYGFQTLLVAPKQRKSLPAEVSTETVKEIPVSSVYLDNNMWRQMKDRVYQYKPFIQAGQSPGISTPTNRSSTPCSPPSRNRRGGTVQAPLPASTSSPALLSECLFANMAFAISYEDSSRKTIVADLIQSNGGLVLQESFLDLLEADSLQLKEQFSELSFTALLTERHSRKEKYMQALALGLPCLSGRWIEASVSSNKPVDWITYLLPAGESAELDGATRSRTLSLDPDLKGTTIKNMISSRPKIFADSRVMIVMGKGKAEAKRKPYLFLIRALGAGKIELEPDLPSAKATVKKSIAENGSDPAAIEYIFVDDRDVEAAKAMFSPPTSGDKDKGHKKGGSKPERGKPRRHREGLGVTDDVNARVKVMCNEDIIQSLILGRLWMG